MTLVLPSTPRLCDVEGCGKRHLARGFCNLHYTRSRAGTPLEPPSKRDPAQIVNGEKWCQSCGIMRPVERFTRLRSGPAGLAHRCKDCHRDKVRMERFGVTPEQVADMLAAQGGVCASCRQPESTRSRSGGTRALAIDHDHTTGVVRGLLCHDCNVSLGLLGEDPDRLRALALYIERHQP